MRYCQRCATAWDRLLGRATFANQRFLESGICEYCLGPGPTSGVASADVVSGRVEAGARSPLSGQRHLR